MLKIYNTLSKRKEEFTPITPNSVGIYVCGMTVYDRCHIGHARIMVAFDVIVRHLRNRFDNVNFVRNITDIDDKIIKRAAQNGEDIHSLTTRFIKLMHLDEQALKVLPPDAQPRATGSIDAMLYLVKTLLDKGFAYQGKNGDVYYDVHKFAQYGRLSGKNLNELEAGTRVEVADDKKNPFDFVLWKKLTPQTLQTEPSWESPWGAGRPGWHLECSAMSNHYLGNHFDIHGGGADLTFPHHENEIAQSEGANGCTLANTWMHVGFVNTDNEKMSKSLGNFFTISDVLKKYDGEVIRYFIISSHYRSPLNYSDENLNVAKSALTRLYIAIRDLNINPTAVDEVSMRFDYEENFLKAMDDDFNTPVALSVLFAIAKHLCSITDEHLQASLASLIRKLGSHLGILQNEDFLTAGIQLSSKEIQEKIKQRTKAKSNKNFELADNIRDKLSKLGIILEDGPTETTWRRG